MKEKTASNSLLRLLFGTSFNKIISVVLIIAICSIISYFYLISHDRVRKIYEKEARSTVIELEKSFLINTVNNLILQIEASRETAERHYRHEVENKYSALKHMKNATCETFKDNLFAEFGLHTDPRDNPTNWTVFIWDEGDNLIYAPDGYWEQDIALSLKKVKPLLRHYRMIEHRGTSCLFGYSEEYIENTVKSTIAAIIKNLQLDSGSHIWVNEILNYEGGENYAVRRINPQLPVTEGNYLSTDMTDVMGNYPYLIELEGIKEEGELFYRYYFKAPSSESISEKLNYAKLYGDYNWVIAMAIEDNILERHIMQANEKTRAATFSSALQLLIILIVLVLSFLGIMLIFEKQRFKYNRKQMELEISHDPLTNAKSRRFGLGYLEKIFSEYMAAKDKPPIALMLFDIDNFKSINDLYGHLEGDRVLQAVVQAIYRIIRNTDELFRLGGDEFVGVFYGIGEKHTFPLVNKIVEAVAAMDYRVGNEKIDTSISIGISYFRVDDRGYYDALKRADEAMYISKKKGGNQVTIH